MKVNCRIFVIFFWIFPIFCCGQSQCDVGGINTASDHDNFFGVYDTVCVGGCQHYWVTNADCPEFRDIGFHWVFHGLNRNDTLVGDTVYYCFSDTGTFLMDIYASNLNMDSSYNLNARNIILPCPPTADFIANHETICTNQSVTFTAKTTRLVNRWEWVFEGGSPAAYVGEHPPPIFYQDTGRFSVQLLASNPYGSDGIQKTQFINVKPGPQPTHAPTYFQIKEGEQVLLQACAEGDTYSWQPFVSAESSIEIQPEETGQYTCEVSTLNNCSVNCNYTVFVQNGLLLPTAFSPNGDGLNDEFRILNSNIKLLAFNIYNRWGERVFTTGNQRIGWDGTFKNEAQDIGVYTWSADYIVTGSGKQKSAKGNVTLVR